MFQAGLRPGVGILALTFAFILAIKLLRFVKSVPLGPSPQPALAGADGTEGLAPNDPMMRVGDPRGASGRGGGSKKVELTDPSLTAKVVKAWMSED